MHTLSQILIALVALEHFYFMYFEMFAWETIGKKTFKSLPAHLFTPTKTLAANQGLYNGFLAAGLVWSFFISDAQWSANVSLFFLACVAVAGIYGALTASKRIFYVQALPAVLAMATIVLSTT
jgi:putative membrane protein